MEIEITGRPLLRGAFAERFGGLAFDECALLPEWDSVGACLLLRAHLGDGERVDVTAWPMTTTVFRAGAKIYACTRPTGVAYLDIAKTEAEARERAGFGPKGEGEEDERWEEHCAAPQTAFEPLSPAHFAAQEAAIVEAEEANAWLHEQFAPARERFMMWLAGEDPDA